MQLITPIIISNDDIYEALCSIGDDKVAGSDGYNSLFFKRTWPIIKEEVNAAIKDFLIHKPQIGSWSRLIFRKHMILLSGHVCSKINFLWWKPLIDKISVTISSRKDQKKLSFPGRTQLTQTVIFSMQAYWALFTIPANVLHLIDLLANL